MTSCCSSDCLHVATAVAFTASVAARSAAAAAAVASAATAAAAVAAAAVATTTGGRRRVLDLIMRTGCEPSVYRTSFIMTIMTPISHWSRSAAAVRAALKARAR